VFAINVSDHFDHDAFWQTVIRWFIDHPMLDRVHIGPIVDFIHHQRFVPEQVFVNDRIGIEPIESTQPRQPNFTIRGRTPETLMRQVHRWHTQLAGDNRVQVASWSPSSIEPFVLIEGSLSENKSPAQNAKKWVIRELLSTQSLVTEGRQLKHCVASYATSCERRHSSIWTMEMEAGNKTTKMLTIEVRLLTRTIVQVRGKLNRLQTDKEKSVIERWAAASKLKLQVGID